ncbi:transposase [Halocatena marina]|uniref:Transposase n=1 Tax=Halocatena marina TaxID=2934937 RepID=A0ABD5YY30_9EURY|nr:transposase [Halocatena marina]
MEGADDHLDRFVADVTTIVQSQCERWESYADIETLICHLPIDHLTFAAHDASAPYTEPYPIAIHVRAALLTEINGWDETALHDHLRTHPSLRQNLGFESLPNQSTFWRTWNERFSEALRDAIQECADAIVKGARACKVSLPDRIGSDEADESEDDTPPEHQFVAEKTDEVWQQAKPFVTDAFALKRGQNWQIHENAFWEQHTYMGMCEDMYARSGPASFSLDTSRGNIPTGSTHRYQIGKLSVAEIREMLRDTTRMLIARARQNGELDGLVFTAIDVTKGFPFTGDIEDHEDDILGYKDGNDYYQWAVLKIVGMDVPLVLDAIQREEDIEERKQKAQDGDVDTSETVVFETNHPYVTARDAGDQQMDGKEFVHMIERLIRWCRHRWGIENGFKKQRHFMVRTTSTERDYRFFNFAFACVLYNVWRLVDLLVKLAIDGENQSYKPRVDANQFLTVAKQCYGLDPPD